VVFADKVVRFTPAQVAVTGSPTAAVEIGGINGPQGIAFDSAGNMWVASGGDATIVRVDASRLAASGTGGDVAITPQTPAPVIGPLPDPHGIAFDGSGNLWAAFDVTIVKLTPADLAGTGPKTVTPAVQLKLTVAALTSGIAFDEQGGLWVASAMGKFGRLAPTQLAASADVALDTLITSADVGYAGWFAIYPAPAFTPLYARLP
jgi:streptogramin lyase